MRHTHFLFLTLTFTFFIRPVDAQPSAYEIIKKGEDALRGTSSYTRAKILVEKSRTKRTLVFDSWEVKQGKRSFIRILKPKKDSRITFLKIRQNLWQYIPKIGKEIKIEASLMSDSWMGSDFTNDDLVRETSILDDYDHSLQKSEDEKLYKILLTGKPQKPVVWDRIISYARKTDYLPQIQEFYDHKNRLKKKMVLSQYRKMGGRLIPTQFQMMSIKNKKVRSTTTMNYLKAKFNLNIPARIFSKSNLRK